MRPIKIELFVNKHNTLNMTVLGIGNVGEDAVKKYPFTSNPDMFGYFSTLTFCSDGILRNPDRLPFDFDNIELIRTELEGTIKKTDWLFIVTDINNEDDLKNAVRFAELHKDTASCPFDALVQVGNYIDEKLEIPKVFDLSISVDNFAEAYKPIYMLISGIPAGDIGLDFTDVMYVAKKSPVMKFAQNRVRKVNQCESLIAPLMEKLVENRKNNEVQNMMVLYNAPAYCPFEVMLNIGEHLSSIVHDGDIIWQVKFHDESDDSLTVSILYGVQE